MVDHHPNMNPDVDEARDRARLLWAWADGYEDTNADHARRCRMAARDLLDLCAAYEDERNGRKVMQANYERALKVMTSRLYERAAYGPTPANDGERAKEDAFIEELKTTFDAIEVTEGSEVEYLDPRDPETPRRADAQADADERQEVRTNNDEPPSPFL